jgi:alkaline phosphatase D
MGVQTGDATATSVILQVHTTEAELDVTLMRADGSDGWVEDRVEVGLIAAEGLVRVELDGLLPDTAYNLVAQVPGGDRRSRVARFRTALDDSGHRVLTLGVTSCFKENRPWPSQSLAAQEKLDAYLLLGDTVYADGAVLIEEYRAFWTEYLSTQGLLDVTASTSVVATWDDHEVANNWHPEDLLEGQLETALQAYREGLPQRTGPGGTGVWRSLSWGRVAELFVLDCRGEREGETLYISVEQMEWLKAALLASTARFKLILNSVPITDMTAMVGSLGANDRWNGYPAQRSELLDHIIDQGVTGVLFLTGDVHFGQIGMVDPVGGPAEHLWEVYCGPAGSFINPAAELFIGDPQYPVLVSTWNWVRLTLDPGLGTIRVNHMGDAGETLSDMTLSL